LLNHVPMTGIFDKHLSLADTCHVVWTMHLYWYWPLVHLWVTVLWQSQRNLIETCCVPMTCLCLTSRWVSCEWTVSFITLSGHVFRLWECHSWQVCLNMNVWPNQEGVGRVWQVIRGAACAMHGYWNICQEHHFWECGFTFRCVWMAVKRVVCHYLLTEGLFLYAFLWVIPRRLNFICQRFGTHCPIFIDGYEDGTDSVFLTVGI